MSSSIARWRWRNRPQTLVLAQEQLAAEVFLKLADAYGETRRDTVQRLRRGVDRAGVGHGAEGAELRQLHLGILALRIVG